MRVGFGTDVYTHSAVFNVYKNVVLENSIASTLAERLCIKFF